MINETENTIFENGDAGSAAYFYNNTSKNYRAYIAGIEPYEHSGFINPLGAFFIKTVRNNTKMKIKHSHFSKNELTKIKTKKEKKDKKDK